MGTSVAFWRLRKRNITETHLLQGGSMSDEAQNVSAETDADKAKDQEIQNDELDSVSGGTRKDFIPISPIIPICPPYEPFPLPLPGPTFPTVITHEES
jgi:hypothetical protein